jgi:hypothetical protein
VTTSAGRPTAIASLAPFPRRSADWPHWRYCTRTRLGPSAILPMYCITLYFIAHVLYYHVLYYPCIVLPMYCITMYCITLVLYYHVFCYPCTVLLCTILPMYCITMYHITHVLYYHVLYYPCTVLPCAILSMYCITLTWTRASLQPKARALETGYRWASGRGSPLIAYMPTPHQPSWAIISSSFLSSNIYV